MDERSFDALLRRALMDANLERFREALDRANDAAPTFSTGYLRQRMRLLADPLGWARKTARPLWKKALQSAACVLLACTVTLGALMAVSPTVRAAVLNWLREISGSEVVYHASGGDALETPPSWRPTWLPEGWVMTDNRARQARSWWMFIAKDGEKRRLTCACFDPSQGDIGTIINGADAGRVRTTVTVQGYTADYYEGESDSLLVWEDSEGRLFWLKTGWWVDWPELERIAESMTFYDQAETAYEMTWAPEGYEELDRFETNGAVQLEWYREGEILTWQYVTDPLCPWELPEREPEAVTVNGLPAQYWGSQVPEDEAAGGDGTYYEMGDVTITVGTIYGTEESGVLAWTDPETNTAFRLTGNLGREDLFRMAESVTAKEIS